MAVEKSLYLKKEYTESYDVTTGDTVITMRLNLDSEQIRSGLIKEVGSRNFAVLVAIASFVSIFKRISWDNGYPFFVLDKPFHLLAHQSFCKICFYKRMRV